MRRAAPIWFLLVALLVGCASFAEAPKSFGDMNDEERAAFCYYQRFQLANFRGYSQAAGAKRVLEANVATCAEAGF